MASSRVFIKGLPVTLSEAEVRSHFSQKGTVTDVRWMPKRRIAYIGYKSADEAASTVKYFNRSYVHTSKIAVEAARPVCRTCISFLRTSTDGGQVSDSRSESLPQGALSNQISGSVVSRIVRKRKRDQSEKDSESSQASKKFQEFLYTMAGTAKLNNWSNEVSVPVADGMVTDDMELVQHDPVNDVTLSIIDSLDDETHGAKGEPQETVLKGSSALSDDEWLRVRTSRRLDLTDDVDSRLNTSLYSLDQGFTTSPINAGLISVKKGSQAGAVVPSLVQDGKTSPSSSISLSGRLFVRNLSYETTEDDLRALFSKYGPVKEAHLAVDAKSGFSKGFGYILYDHPGDAARVLGLLDGTGFQGRLLHILPAAPQRDHAMDEFSMAKLPLKKQMELKRKSTAASNQFNWNSMYMNSDAVVSSVARRLGISKAEFLDPTSSDAAVRQAHAETHTIQEVKEYLKRNGADLGAFEQKQKDDKIVLIKNFPFGTSAEELRKLLAEHGELARLVLPPAGTIAIAEYQAAACGRAAFTRLAYRKFKDSILFLEKGPKGLFSEAVGIAKNSIAGPKLKPSAAEITEPTLVDKSQQDTTIFIKNLNFSTTAARLQAVLKPLDGFLWCRVKTKVDGKNVGRTLSMGFGFAGFETAMQARDAVKSLNGYILEGHSLNVTIARREEDKTRNDEDSKKQGSKKIAIKNLPFEVTKKDVTSLLSRYGTLRTLRLPKKVGNRTRGFAFAEFMTAREAGNAMEALKDTHLLGRRLALEYAVEDAENPEDELEQMSKKVSKQTAAVAFQQLRAKSKVTKGTAEDAI